MRELSSSMQSAARILSVAMLHVYKGNTPSEVGTTTRLAQYGNFDVFLFWNEIARNFLVCHHHTWKYPWQVI